MLGLILNSVKYLYSLLAICFISEFRTLTERSEVNLLGLTVGMYLLFWVFEIATMLLRTKDFKHGSNKCKMVYYLKNVFKCTNKGEYQNRAVFSNNIFYISTLSFSFYLGNRASTD